MKIRNIILIFFCVALYSIPMMLVVKVSDKEADKYKEDQEFDFMSRAYGDVKAVERMDVNEVYTVDVNMICIDEKSVEYPSGIELKCGVEDELQVGDVIGVYKGLEYKSEFDGCITNVEFVENSVSVYYYDFNNLVYEAYFDEKYYNEIDNKKFKDKHNKKIEVIRKSNIIEDGKFKVYLTIPKGTVALYGKQQEGMELYSDVVYKNVLVVDVDCVYNDGDNKYIRTVDEDGLYLDDIPVSVGYSDGKIICISGEGVDEDTLCDSGYSVQKEDADEEY